MAKLRPKPADVEAYSKNGKKSEQREGNICQTQKARGIPDIDLLVGVASKFSNYVKWLANLTLRNTVIHVYTLSWTYPLPIPSSSFLL